MEEINRTSICISSWPGCGSTSLALMLAFLLKRRYFSIGSLYRSLGEKMGFSSEGSARPKFDKYVEDIIGKTVDSYTDYKLLNGNNLLFESDIAAFRIGKHPRVFSIFLKADKEERIRRVELEGRDQAELVLEKRDVLLRDVYQKLWDIDFFDEELIRRKYNLLLDNSNMSLEAELKIIFQQMREYNSFQELEAKYWEDIIKETPVVVEDYLTNGKSSLLEKLHSQQLLITPEETMRDIAKTFPEDVATYPENIRNLFLGIS